MEKARVRFFTTKFDSRGYGFLDLEDGNTLYFQRTHGGPVAQSEDGLQIVQGQEVRRPQDGDEIMFERSRNNKGPIAQPWCFKADWDAAEAQANTNEASPADAEVEDDPSRHLMGQINQALKAIAACLEKDDGGGAARILTSMRETFPSRFEAIEGRDGEANHWLQQTLTAAEKDILACQTRVKRDRARQIKERFERCLNIGDLSAATAALTELSGPAGRAGLEAHLGSKQAVDQWIARAQSRLTKVGQELLQKRGKKFVDRKPVTSR